MLNDVQIKSIDVECIAKKEQSKTSFIFSLPIAVASFFLETQSTKSGDF